MHKPFEVSASETVDAYPQSRHRFALLTNARIKAHILLIQCFSEIILEKWIFRDQMYKDKSCNERARLIFSYVHVLTTDRQKVMFFYSTIGCWSGITPKIHAKKITNFVLFCWNCSSISRLSLTFCSLCLGQPGGYLLGKS